MPGVVCIFDVFFFIFVFLSVYFVSHWILISGSLFLLSELLLAVFRDVNIYFTPQVNAEQQKGEGVCAERPYKFVPFNCLTEAARTPAIQALYTGNVTTT